MEWVTKNISNYIHICHKAYNSWFYFRIFKKNKYYRMILEHVSKKQGQLYLDNIDDSYNQYMHIFKKNDKIGFPKKYRYKIGRFSPTTLRYIKVLSDLNHNCYLYSPVLLNIIEIGGGYGGQCLIINQFTNFKSYKIFDLPIVNKLQRKYLNFHNVKNVKFNHLIKKNTCDLIISNYAWSEFDKELRDKYTENILRNAKHGYITINRNIEQCISELKDIKSISIRDDVIKDCKIIEW